MNLSPMSFKDFVWSVNPEKISVKNSENLQKSTVPHGADVTRHTSTQPREITGSGVFFGKEAYWEINTLESMLSDKSSGTLFLPGIKPMTAFFTQLTIDGEAKKDWIQYSFKFIQDTMSCEKKRSEYSNIEVVGDEENLFEIANRCNVSVEELMNKNFIKSPFDVISGQEVRLK